MEYISINYFDAKTFSKMQGNNTILRSELNKVLSDIDESFKMRAQKYKDEYIKLVIEEKIIIED